MDKLENNSAIAQYSRLMEWLKTHGHIATIEYRKCFVVLTRAFQIFELRHNIGVNMTKVWVNQQTHCEKFHRIAKNVFTSRNGV